MSINTSNIKIGFNTPIKFDKDFINKKNPLKRALIAIGSSADDFLSIRSKKSIKVTATSKEEIPLNSTACKTATKVMCFVLTAFTLPALALIKSIYRNWAVKNFPKVQNKPPEQTKPPKPDESSTNPNSQSPNNQLKSKQLGDEAQQSMVLLRVGAKQVQLPPEEEENQVQQPSEQEQNNEPEKPASSPNVEKKKEATAEQRQEIDKHLEALNEDKLLPIEHIQHLLEVKKLLSEIKSYNIDTITGNLLDKIQKKRQDHQFIDIKELRANKMNGQILTKSKPHRGLPQKFLDLAVVVDDLIDDIILTNQKNRKILKISNLTPEQRRTLWKKQADLREREAGGGNTPIRALSESGRSVYNLRNIVVLTEEGTDVIDGIEFVLIPRQKADLAEVTEYGSPNIFDDEEYWENWETAPKNQPKAEDDPKKKDENGEKDGSGTARIKQLSNSKPEVNSEAEATKNGASTQEEFGGTFVAK